MIQSLTNQPASMLSGLLSGFTQTKTRDGQMPAKAARADQGKLELDPAAIAGAKVAQRTPDGVPVAVARAFPDFAALALGIVDRARLSAAAGGAEAETQAKTLTAISAQLGPAQGQGSLADALSQAQDALKQAAQSGDPADRAQAKTALVEVVGKIGRSLAGLAGIGASLQSDIDQEADAIKQGLHDFAAANAAIVEAKAQGADLTALNARRQDTLNVLAGHVALTFQDRPDGALIPKGENGADLPEDVANASPQDLARALGPGRLKALLTLRDNILPDTGRALRTLAASVTDAVNASGSAPPAQSLKGTDTGLAADERLNLSGDAGFVLLDNADKVQTALILDFSARTRRLAGTPPSGVNLASPQALVKAVNDAFKGQATLSFEKGVFTFAAQANGAKVAIVPGDKADKGRGLVAVTGLGRLLDGPRAESFPTAFQPLDSHGLDPDATIAARLTSPKGQVLTARIEGVGKSFQDLFDKLNNREDGLGAVQLVNLDKDGVLTKAFAADWVGARLTLDGPGRAGTSQGLNDVFNLTPAAKLDLASGIGTQDVLAQPLVVNDKTRKGVPLARGDDKAALAALAQAFGGEILVPASLGKPNRILPLPAIAGEAAQAAADKAEAAGQVQAQNLTFARALKDERGRLSSASFGAELAHLATLQTSRNVGGRIEANAVGLLAHLDRARALKTSRIESPVNQLAA